MANQLGQLLLIDVRRAVWRPSLERMLQGLEPAGLVFREIATAGALAEVIQRTTQALGPTPFLCVEDEGGGPLSNLFIPFVRADPPRLDAERAGDLIGRAMAILGLNLNLGPTVDLPEASEHGDKSKTGSGKTADSSRLDLSPLETARCGEAFLRGLARHRILACARHFPGLPSSFQWSRSELPVVTKSMAALWREDLVPYRTLRDEVPLIQVSHAAYKAYDYEFLRSAPLSPGVVEGLLRVKVGYRGVALADVSAVSRVSGIEAGEASVQSLAAGCDLVLVSDEERTLEEVKDSLASALESGRLSPERVEQALARVRNAKKGLSPLRKQPTDRDLARLERDFRNFASA